MKKVAGDLALIICLLSFVDVRISAREMKLPDSEIEALRAIASKLKIPPSMWDFEVNPCNGEKGWVNVTSRGEFQTNSEVRNLTCGDCNTTTNTCHVTGIELKSLNLTGVLPEEFSNLTHLKILDLTRNVITGSIPAAWGTLPLVNLLLLGNRISGRIPDEIGNIDTLVYLGVEANSLEGPIPRALGRLSNLSRLLLSSNKFIGEIPDSLSNLKNLTDFRIDGTNISGKIPSFIGNWTNLKRLDLQGTSLEGSFPPTFSSLRLDKLWVSDFKGDGSFPPLKEMDLQVLVLRNCSISTLIPGYIGFMKSLDTLDLSFNNFRGEIPGSFKQLMSELKSMYLNNNMLNGIIPPWMFGNKPIDLSYNYFTGPDKGHSCQEKNVNLVCSLSSSKSSGTWCLRKNLPCPVEAENYELFINCGGERVEVNGKSYEGDTKDSGRSMFSLFDSQKPKWAYSNSGDFVSNPNAKYTVANTSILDIKEPELYKTARTAASSLRYYGLCLQNGPYKVTLHFAEIILTDNNTYSSVGVRVFDVFIQGEKVLEDFNIAEAAKGTGEVVKSFNASVNGTLEIHLRWSGKGTNSIPDRGVYGPLISAISVEPNFKPKLPGKDFPLSAKISIIIVSCVIFILAVLFWKVLHRNRQKNKELKYLGMQGANFTINQIKVATRQFDASNKIGEGGFGPVYKGILPDGRIVAVKQHSPHSRQGNREFVNEIGTISSLQHPNLVTLFGCCIGEDHLMLIYEYMENNSLARALFGHEETRLNLKWQTRRKICLGIARGLAYLHEESGLKIIHRDVKATNVLLDRDLNAKISDFGLARLDDDDEQSHISTRVCGTLGYMAPEYATRGYLTEKADVYSYGVVVLEIVSGKSATNFRMGDFLHPIDWVYDLQERGKLLEIVDPSMGSDYSKFEVEQMLNLAILCTSLSPTPRPTMASVVKMIEGGGPILVRKPDGIESDQVKSKSETSPMMPKLSVSGSWTSSSSTMCDRVHNTMP